MTVTATDDDTRGVTVSESDLTVAEDGGKATYTVVLDSEPTSTVTVTVSSNRTANATVDKPSLTFTTANWDDEQEVTVTGVNDDVQNATDQNGLHNPHRPRRRLRERDGAVRISHPHGR